MSFVMNNYAVRIIISTSRRLQLINVSLLHVEYSFTSAHSLPRFARYCSIHITKLRLWGLMFAPPICLQKVGQSCSFFVIAWNCSTRLEPPLLWALTWPVRSLGRVGAAVNYIH